MRHASTFGTRHVGRKDLWQKHVVHKARKAQQHVGHKVRRAQEHIGHEAQEYVRMDSAYGTKHERMYGTRARRARNLSDSFRTIANILKNSG